MSLPDLLIEPVVRAALAEDLGRAGFLLGAATGESSRADWPTLPGGA